MLLDAKPEKRVVIEYPSGDRSKPIGKVVDTYMSHFSTCPDADKFRKRP